MKQKITEFFKSFTLFELIFLPVSLIAVLTVSIVFKCDALSIVYSVVGIMATFFLSKGVFFAPLCLIVMYGLYVAQSYLQSLYGEAFLYLVLLIPLQIYTFVNWVIKQKQGRNSNVLVMRDLKWREWTCLAVGTVAIGVASYFALRALNTNYLILSAISFAGACLANYLTMRGSIYQFVVYLINDIVLIILWLMPVFEGLPAGTDFVPMAVAFAAYIANNIYGLVNWYKIRKNKKSEEENGTTSASR